MNKMTYNQGGENQFLRPLQELSIGLLSETATAGCCSEVFSLPWNGWERNSENLLLFLFHGTEIPSCFSSAEGSEGNSESLLWFLFHRTEFRVVFSSAEGFGTEFREWNSIGKTISSVYPVFRGITFLSEIPNPRQLVTLTPAVLQLSTIPVVARVVISLPICRH
jgi:hypothetical protein